MVAGVLVGLGESRRSTGQQGNWEPEAYFRHTRDYNVSPESFDRAGYETAWRSSPNAQCSVGELIRSDVVRVFDNCRFRSVAPRMWCAKEVGGHTGKILQLWRGIFPGGRLLLLVRDPLMVVRSVLRDMLPHVVSSLARRALLVR